MTAPMASILPQYTPDEVRGRRAIPIALQPPVFMKLADALDHCTSPAGRGLGAIDNAFSIQSGGYRS